jgi:hypothetical protein
MKETANNFNGTLENIFGVLIEKEGVIKPSRQQTIKGSLNKYAALLGSTIATCLPKTFVLPPAERNALIDNGLARTTKSRSGADGLGADAFRNVKNDVSFFLRRAAEHKLLEPDLVELASYQESRGRYTSFPRGRPNRGEQYITPKYTLDPVPISFQNELDAYRIWTTSPYTPKRPASLARREITHDKVEEIIEKFAGYLVKFKGFRAEEITLSCLTVPQNLVDFIGWFVENRGGKYTSTVSHMCSKVKCLATYLQITAATGDVKGDMEERIKGIKEFTDALPAAVRVVDKRARWISLKELDAIGVACDPAGFAKRDLCVRRVRDFARLFRDFEQGIFPEGGGFRDIALQAVKSLMLRLIVRIPLRQRNLRIMEWNPIRPELGRHLYKCDDLWRIRFSGKDLKISHKDGKENLVNFEFPPDLSADLDRYMKWWRPILVDSTTNLHCAPERAGEMPKIVDQEYFFINAWGRPFTSERIRDQISNLTYKYVGVAMSPHIIRSVWSTEFLEEKGMDGVATCAYMVNDTIETILRTYADLLTPNRQAAATSWLAGHLSN